MLANEILGLKVLASNVPANCRRREHAIAENNPGNLTGMDETEKLRHIIEECVTRQLRGFNSGQDRRDVAYEVAHCVLSRIRSIGIKVVPKSPPWPQVDR